MAVQLITKAAYARHRGCDEKAVRKAVAEGRISLIDGKIDAAVADIQWAQNTRARADSGRTAALPGLGIGQGGAAATEAPTGPDNRAAAQPASDQGYQDFRVRRERADAERAERENDKEAGRLITRDTTERGIFDAFRALRDRIMAAAPRTAPKLIGMADVRDAERVIADELRKAFEGWEASMLEKLPPKEPK